MSTQTAIVFLIMTTLFIGFITCLKVVRESDEAALARCEQTQTRETCLYILRMADPIQQSEDTTTTEE